MGLWRHSKSALTSTNSTKSRVSIRSVWEMRPTRALTQSIARPNPRASRSWVQGTEGPNHRKTFPAIYELKGDTLRNCYDSIRRETSGRVQECRGREVPSCDPQPQERVVFVFPAVGKTSRAVLKADAQGR